MNTREALTAVAVKCGPRTSINQALTKVPVEAERIAEAALTDAYAGDDFGSLKGGEAQTACLLAAEFAEG